MFTLFGRDNFWFTIHQYFVYQFSALHSVGIGILMCIIIASCITPSWVLPATMTHCAVLCLYSLLYHVIPYSWACIHLVKKSCNACYYCKKVFIKMWSLYRGGVWEAVRFYSNSYIRLYLEDLMISVFHFPSSVTSSIISNCPSVWHYMITIIKTYGSELKGQEKQIK